jgi:hypothetical protein
MLQYVVLVNAALRPLASETVAFVLAFVFQLAASVFHGGQARTRGPYGRQQELYTGEHRRWRLPSVSGRPVVSGTVGCRCIAGCVFKVLLLDFVKLQGMSVSRSLEGGELRTSRG